MTKDKNLLLIGAGVFILIAGFFMTQTPTSGGPANKVTFGAVDKLRKETIVRQRMARDKVEVENFRNAPNLDSRYRAVSEEPAQDSGLRLESSQNTAIQDSQDTPGNLSVQSLESSINQRLVNDQRAAQMTKIQKRRLADDYRRRALAMGYQVELNDQLEVIKVQKIRPKGPASYSPPAEVQSIEEEDYGDEE